ncbi:DUF6629 family protein [Flavobacterium granuli]|uniref:Uncharacterized protein n=1 Tax=Flavobacterium granuli TaxID=280093 RepID=A0A1M5IF49_9FLAO|nr:DUF6629 family protein [Flavobacterium granuli]PRZ27932.1 hypothetical protein BC624_101215 [Flavobacterium granuli]SHG26699.1 hypothetical protein SAMN05443373_101215 [Flavobacterium granuli]
MCFSASASFGAAIILSAISISTIKKVEKPSQIYFACIPLLFCAQQLSEGFLWLALTQPAYALFQNITTYIFLFFAQILWPVWLPFSLYKLENNSRIKQKIKLFLGMGILVSFYLAYCLISFDVKAEIVGYHISYIQNYPILFGNYGDLLYIMATTLPPLISSIKRMWTLGATIFISYVFTLFFYADYVISVWCFFASAISVAVLYLIMQMKHPTKKISLKY